MSHGSRQIGSVRSISLRAARSVFSTSCFPNLRHSRDNLYLERTILRRIACHAVRPIQRRSKWREDSRYRPADFSLDSFPLAKLRVTRFIDDDASLRENSSRRYYANANRPNGDSKTRLTEDESFLFHDLDDSAESLDFPRDFSTDVLSVRSDDHARNAEVMLRRFDVCNEVSCDIVPFVNIDSSRRRCSRASRVNAWRNFSSRNPRFSVC